MCVVSVRVWCARACLFFVLRTRLCVSACIHPSHSPAQVPGALYIESSTLWRQEHNGYSHQDPMFISNLLNMKHELVHVYLPPDANSVLACLEQCFTSHNVSPTHAHTHSTKSAHTQHVEVSQTPSPPITLALTRHRL